MGSGDSPPQRRSFFHKIFVGSSTLYQSIGFGNQESAEICDQDISPVEILSMALKVCQYWVTTILQLMKLLVELFTNKVLYIGNKTNSTCGIYQKMWTTRVNNSTWLS